MNLRALHFLFGCFVPYSGGPRAWWGQSIPDSVEDGFFLAEAIAAMDLNGADLLVLSVRETGLDEIASEDVFGQQCAFKKAGVLLEFLLFLDQ